MEMTDDISFLLCFSFISLLQKNRKANVAFVYLSTVACNRNVFRTGLPSSPGGRGGVVQRRHVSPEVSSLVLSAGAFLGGSPPLYSVSFSYMYKSSLTHWPSVRDTRNSQ
jgi:hypothetical protein